ncbi:polymorphic toxin-type HINT domain-containing protein [Actinophytocola glycyrrhizae]|uniref:Polymorphic toxin-type HINT domain-containing protein n=1 Tax=Actinophytocola glycyrrhizae TaxID=2044873 RepID=A0ABV9SCF6_9PSEU
MHAFSPLRKTTPSTNLTDHELQRADLLGRGDVLSTSDGPHVQVANFAVADTSISLAYNLTVEGLHTFYVRSAKQRDGAGVLVHNACEPFTPGEIYYHQIETDAGPLEMMAQVDVDGSVLVLKDIAVYGTGGMDRDSLGVRGAAAMLRAVREDLFPQAQSQGYTHLRITGVRRTGPVGHEPDITFPQVEAAMENTEKFKDAKRLAEAMFADGADAEKVLHQLRVEGGTMVESMLVLIRVLGIPLVEAREIVHLSKTWSDQRAVHDEFHEILAHALETGEISDQDLRPND